MKKSEMKYYYDNDGYWANCNGGCFAQNKKYWDDGNKYIRVYCTDEDLDGVEIDYTKTTRDEQGYPCQMEFVPTLIYNEDYI